MAKSRIIVMNGIQAEAAKAIVGQAAAGLTAAGSTQGTALSLPADINQITTAAAGTGVILDPLLNPGDEQIVYNKGANALLVYPPVGGVINALATNAGYSVATATPFARIVCVAPLTFIALQSA